MTSPRWNHQSTVKVRVSNEAGRTAAHRSIPGESIYLSSKTLLPGVVWMAAGIASRPFRTRGFSAELVISQVSSDVRQPATGLILGVFLSELTGFQIQLETGDRCDANQLVDAGTGRRQSRR